MKFDFFGSTFHLLGHRMFLPADPILQSVYIQQNNTCRNIRPARSPGARTGPAGTHGDTEMTHKRIAAALEKPEPEARP